MGVERVTKANQINQGWQTLQDEPGV